MNESLHSIKNSLVSSLDSSQNYISLLSAFLYGKIDKAYFDREVLKILKKPKDGRNIQLKIYMISQWNCTTN